MQKIIFKKVYLFLIFLIFKSLGGYGQNNNDPLATADSLFQSKKFTESFEIYENIFEKKNENTPAMLLKMAFIKEGLGDYSNSLYYLNIYFSRTLDQNALAKIKELAEEHSLKGYSESESFLFNGIFRRYLGTLKIVILLIMVGWLILTVLYARKGRKQPYVSYIFLFLVSLGFLIFNNTQISPRRGVISENNTYLMAGPSGASDVIRIIEKGHMVKILEKHGPWTKINWEGEELFLRETKILELI